MILVTGSDGIVGRGICKKLQELSIPFMPLTHRPKEYTSNKALVIDLANDIDSLTPYRHEISGIVHLAAAVPHSISYPDNDISADMTRRIDQNIHAFQKQSGASLIYMSTCGLYNRLTSNTKYEDDHDSISVSSPYFSAKADGESLFLSQGTSTILRLAAPVGVGLKPQLVLSRFISTARENGVINIWGSGSREQDFIDTVDVADLIVRVLKKPKRTIINVATGMPVTMMKLAKKVVEVVEKGSIKISPKIDPSDGETARYSISRAKDYYAWKPQCTLEDSIYKLIPENFEENQS